MGIKSIKWFSLLGLLLFLSVAIAPSIAAEKNNNIDNCSLSEIHEPIVIEGNAEFTIENGVTSGIGTRYNPYIIENWKINNNEKALNGIYIKDTTAHFIIRNCVITNFTDNKNIIRVNPQPSHLLASFGHGIFFKNVRNGDIKNTHIYNNFIGIEMSGEHTRFNSIISCEVNDNPYFGITIWCDSYQNYQQKAYITIADCTIHHNGIFAPPDFYLPAVSIWMLGGVTIENCVLDENGAGIVIDTSSFNRVHNCKVMNHWFGIEKESIGIAIAVSIVPFNRSTFFAYNNEITHCDILNNYMGIANFCGIRTRIEKNNIINNSKYGLLFYLLSFSRIRHNNIEENGQYGFLANTLEAQMFCFIDGRRNYWGPTVQSLPNPCLNNQDIYVYLSIFLWKPVLSDPVNDAGCTL